MPCLLPLFERKRKSKNNSHAHTYHCIINRGIIELFTLNETYECYHRQRDGSLLLEPVSRFENGKSV